MSPMGKCRMSKCHYGYMSHGYMSPSRDFFQGGIVEEERKSHLIFGDYTSPQLRFSLVSFLPLPTFCPEYLNKELKMQNAKHLTTQELCLLFLTAKCQGPKSVESFLFLMLGLNLSADDHIASYKKYKFDLYFHCSLTPALLFVSLNSLFNFFTSHLDQPGWAGRKWHFRSKQPYKSHNFFLINIQEQLPRCSQNILSLLKICLLPFFFSLLLPLPCCLHRIIEPEQPSTERTMLASCKSKHDNMTT